MIHELKIFPEYFEAVLSGKKTFEVRKNDRSFHENDLLALNEYDPTNGYTGRSCVVYVAYILQNDEYCKNGYVIMSIRPCCVDRNISPYDPLKGINYGVPLATKRTE